MAGVRLAWRATWKGVVEFYHSNNLTYASSIAYYSLLSLFPFILLVSMVVGRLAVALSGGEQMLVDLLERALPRQFDFLSTQIVALQQSPIELTIAGTVVAVWASMGVFGAITSAVNHAWGVEQPYGYLKHKLVAFIMMLVAGGVVSAALLLRGAVKVSQTGWFAGLATAPWLPDLSNEGYRLVFMPASVLGVGLIYYYLPNTRVRLKDVWYGAVLAALLWRAALAGFAWYLGAFSRIGIHGSVGTVVVFLAWVFLSAVILLYGVEVTAAWARERHQQHPDA
jgi:membrane protein